MKKINLIAMTITSFVLALSQAAFADDQSNVMASYQCGNFSVKVDKKGGVRVDDNRGYYGQYIPFDPPVTGLSNTGTTLLEGPYRSKTDFSDVSDSVIEISKGLLHGDSTGTFGLNYAEKAEQCQKQ